MVDGNVGFEAAGEFGFEGGLVGVEATLFGSLVDGGVVIFSGFVGCVVGKLLFFSRKGERLSKIIPHAIFSELYLYKT